MILRLKSSTTGMTVICAVLVTLAAFAIHAASAQASTPFKFSTKTHVTTSAGIAKSATFAVKSSRSAKVTVTVYRGSKAIRKLTTRRSGSTYTAAWNLRDSGGKLVAGGVYGYTVTAVAGKQTKRGSSKITLPKTSVPVVPVKRWVGYYVSGNMEAAAGLDALEAQTARHADVVNLFVADSEGFPTNRATTLAARGSIPMVTLEFKSLSSGGLSAIINGSHDAYLDSFADSAKKYGGTVYLRPFHEMNGDWYAWGATGSNTPAQLVAAWKHVHDRFVAEGATNVKFVWCVNSSNVPNTAANVIENYWPGDAYVDFTAIDAYNFGTYIKGGTWRTFDSVVAASYAKVTALSTKPVFLAETGSVEQGGCKADWITGQFSNIKTTYPRIVGVCWFNVTDGEDWCVASSPASLAAFRGAIASF